MPHPRTGQVFESPVPPGAGWPGDPADAATPAAAGPADVVAVAASADLDALQAASSVCRACPRLVAWREEVAVTKRRAYLGEPYWGRPVPSFGDPDARVLVVGLAPGAHGANRTGRLFTGDRSGDWITAALHRAGLATSPTSTDGADGLRLVGARMVAPVRCVPPDNVPTTAERHTCAPWLRRELELLRGVRSLLALGGIGWAASLAAARDAGWVVPRPAPRFGHGATATLTRPDGVAVTLVGCYHVSQQNTSTGRLTAAMLDDAVATAVLAAGPLA
nr:uracil-DNA glycosylase [Actinotalea sp. M2MS4P-6]